MRAMAKGYRLLGQKPPKDDALYRRTMAADLISNASYYALVAGKRPLLRGVVLGALAGLGAVFLPERMGLGKKPSRARRSTEALTAGLYLTGGVVAGLVQRRLRRLSIHA